jgi:dolichol kinase
VKRTRPFVLVIYGVVAAVVVWLLQTALTASGAAVVLPPFTLAITLTLIGLVVVAFARPVRRAVRDRENHHVDPFYATRVVVLAKASSIAGSLLFGATIAIVGYLLTRSVVAGVGSILTSGSAVLGSAVLLICGLVAENMCSIPPDDNDKGEKNPATSRPR